MSESDLSDAPAEEIPAEEELKQSLREEVRKADKAGKDVIVSMIREASAQELGLPEGFYTSDKWKPISKAVIRTEFDRLVQQKNEPVDSSNEEEIRQGISKSAPKRTAKQASTAASAPPQKKRKFSPPENASFKSEAEPSYSENDNEEDRPKKRAQEATRGKQTKKVNKPRRSAQISSSGEEDNHVVESGSEMSVVLDEEPVKKRRSKSKEQIESGLKQSKTSKSRSGADNDPEKEEIKKLQGWLVKCGVRKVWGKELKPYETSKAKIKHLKGMLADVGMTGRFSNEKASQIKEARELAADIEAVQEGAQRWGKDENSADDGDHRTRGGRRIVRGAKNYDFLSSDGEETD